MKSRQRELGASAVEYAVVIAVLSVLVSAPAAVFGPDLALPLCRAAHFGSDQECTVASAPGATGSAGEAPQATTTPVEDAAPPAEPSPTPTPEPSQTPAPTQAWPASSAGRMNFNFAGVDQDQLLGCLSIRSNVSWFPDDWNNVTYPEAMVLEVTWSPALAVYSVNPGSDGVWTVQLSEPGRVRLARAGKFDPSGFQPEPEILLVKPDTATRVDVQFIAVTGNAPTLAASAFSISIPY